MEEGYHDDAQEYNTKQFLEFIIKAIVDYPDEVQISEIDGEKTIIYELRVNRSDMGKVIGKKGKNAQAVRTLLAAATKSKKRAVLEILE